MSDTIVLLALLIGLSSPAYADDEPVSTCREGIEAVLRDALAREATTASASRGTLLQLDCVPAPNAREGTVHAVASFRDDATRSYDEGGEGEGYAFILATLSPRNRLRHHVTATALEDGTTEFRGGEFRLDTRFHDLAPGGGAIGVAVSQTRWPSMADRRHDDEFAVFVPEGRGLRRVLGLVRFREEALEGCVGDPCNGARWIATTTTLMPGARKAGGWRAITMREDAEEIAIPPAVVQTLPTSRTRTLIYRDGAYRQEDGSPPPGSDYFGLVTW